MKALVIAVAIVLAAIIIARSNQQAAPEPARTVAPLVWPSPRVECMAQVPNPAAGQNAFAPSTVPVAGHYNGTICVPN